MKKVSLQLFFVAFCLSFASAQYSPSDVLLNINNRKVTAGEFERIYNKNYNINAAEKQTVTDYFDLFLKFKLKVSAALDEGLDTLSSYKNELKGYRDQLAKTYLTDNKAIDSLVREAYDHLANNINVSHILVLFPESQGATDTLACYKKIEEAEEKLKAGEPFEKVALEYSEDPSVKANKGNLGYFGAFRFPYLFESCAYQTPVGQVSKILRASYGYHLIKVLDKKPSPGEVRIAHIMALVPKNSPDSVWMAAKNKVSKYYDRVKSGEEFGKIARESSEDRNSAEKDGELSWFGIGQMVPEFESAAFALKSNGEVSQPVKTAFGWHILKLLDKRGVASFDQVKTEYKSRIMNDERAEIVNNGFIEKLKKQYTYKTYPKNLAAFYKLDSTIYQGKVALKKDVLATALFTIQKTNFTGEDFKAYLQSNPAPSKKVAVKEYIDQSFKKFMNASFLKVEDAQLETKYQDFGGLISEYHDGILLFDIMDRQVWSKASRDSAGLDAFYKQMTNKPVWGERLDGAIFYCKTKQIAEKVKKLVKDTAYKNLTEAQMSKMVCDSTDGNDCLVVDKKLFSKGDHKTIDSISWKVGIYDIPAKDGKTAFVCVWAIRQPETKLLDDVRGLITADYQNYLEEKWIANLLNKYKIVINQDLLSKIANKYKTQK